MFCQYCGKELPDTARFCLGCGKPVPQEHGRAQATGGGSPQVINQPHNVLKWGKRIGLTLATFVLYMVILGDMLTATGEQVFLAALAATGLTYFLAPRIGKKLGF